MNAMNFIPKSSIIVLELKGQRRKDVIREIAEAMVKRWPHLDSDQLIEAIEARESMGSTTMGNGIAIPHAKVQGLNHLTMCFGSSPKGVPFPWDNAEPVRFLFVLLAPDWCQAAHLRVLASLVMSLKSKSVQDQLQYLKTSHEVYELLSQEDARADVE